MACLSRSCILSSGALHVRSSLKRICQPSLKTKVAPLQLHGSQSSISGLQLSLSKPLHLQRQYRSSVLKVEAGRRSFLAELENVREESNGAGPIEFASPLQIVMYPDPKLRAKNKRVNVFDENLEKLIDEMLDIMYKTDGVGLAAPQVGVNVQLMVYNPSGERGKGKEYVLINPKIAKYSKLTDMDMEGCLSFPLIEAPVEVRRRCLEIVSNMLLKGLIRPSFARKGGVIEKKQYLKWNQSVAPPPQHNVAPDAVNFRGVQSEGGGQSRSTIDLDRS